MSVLLRIFKLAYRIDGKLEQVVLLLQSIDSQNKQHNALPADEELLHSSEVKRILGISGTTLYRYKKKNILVPTGIDGKFYRKSDIMRAKGASAG